MLFYEPAVHGRAGSEAAAGGDLFDGERRAPEQARGVLHLFPAQEDVQRFAEDFRGQSADVLRGEVEGPCEVFAAGRLFQAIAVAEIVLGGAVQTLPVSVRELPWLLISGRRHRHARDRSDEVRDIG